jgi:hypothetical protein
LSSWNSYPKVWQVGHGQVKDIFTKTVLVQEKIDGSQFSFGLIEGRLRIKSHHQDISDIVGEYGLFSEAIAYVRELHSGGKLHPEWTYRGEVLQKPCHNRLTYERVPKHSIVGLDVATGLEQYANYTDCVAAFAKLDLEVVPYYHYGIIDNPDTIKTFLDRRPLLGGKMIEGIVIKAYGVYGEDKHTLMAKYVNPAFREISDQPENQKSVDFTTSLIETYRSEARWEKVIQSFREKGLGAEVKDIGPMIGSLTKDIQEECGEEIAKKLWKRYWPHIARGCTNGFAEYFKRKLMEGSFAHIQDGGQLVSSGILPTGTQGIQDPMLAGSLVEPSGAASGSGSGGQPAPATATPSGTATEAGLTS